MDVQNIQSTHVFNVDPFKFAKPIKMWEWYGGVLCFHPARFKLGVPTAICSADPACPR